MDSKPATHLRTCGSSVGLGTFLEQNYGTVDNKKWHPIGYEKSYEQIEKETLSIVLRLKCFHEYLYDRKLIIINNHKQLKLIFNR